MVLETEKVGDGKSAQLGFNVGDVKLSPIMYRPGVHEGDGTVKGVVEPRREL